MKQTYEQRQKKFKNIHVHGKSMKNGVDTIEIEMAVSNEQIRSCYQVMHQLRPHLICKKTFIEQVQRQLKEGYHLAYL